MIILSCGPRIILVQLVGCPPLSFRGQSLHDGKVSIIRCGGRHTRFVTQKDDGYCMISIKKSYLGDLWQFRNNKLCAVGNGRREEWTFLVVDCMIDGQTFCLLWLPYHVVQGFKLKVIDSVIIGDLLAYESS